MKVENTQKERKKKCFTISELFLSSFACIWKIITSDLSFRERKTQNNSDTAEKCDFAGSAYRGHKI